jgi:hypothetical protein
MCLLTLNTTEYPTSRTKTTSKTHTQESIHQNISTSRRPSVHEPSDKLIQHSYTHNRSTRIQIHNPNQEYITRPPLSTSTIRVRQNKSLQNTQIGKKPQRQTTTTSKNDILTSFTEVHTSGRIPKKFKTPQSTHATNTDIKTYLKKASTTSKTLAKKYAQNTVSAQHYLSPPIKVRRTDNVKPTNQINRSNTQRINLSSSTETSPQVQTYSHHYKQAGKVYGNGLVLENNKLDNDKNRSEIDPTLKLTNHTYASCLKASIDPIQQLIELQEAQKQKFNYFVNTHRQHNNKWKNQKHRKQQYQHCKQLRPTKRYYSHTPQQTLYCKSKGHIINNSKATNYNSVKRISDSIDCYSNYYSAISYYPEEDDIIENINIESNCELWDDAKYINTTFSEPIISTENIIATIESTNITSNNTPQDYLISTINKKKRHNPKFQELLNQKMTLRKLKKPSTVLQSHKRHVHEEITKDSTNETGSTRSTRSETTTRSNQSHRKDSREKDYVTKESDDDKSQESTVQIKNKGSGNKEKWTEIKKNVNDINTNPYCPNIPNAVPETIMEKPSQAPNRNIIPSSTIALMITMKGPSHWNQGKGKKRNPIFKIKKILLGFLHAAQRVCPEARLCNVYKDTALKDIIQLDDIPTNETSEKSFIFDAQIYRGTFQGQILLKANKEFSDFIRNTDFHDWLQMENIQIKLQPHTGVKFVKIGFFTDVLNSLKMDKFHVKTLTQWLSSPIPPFELFTDIIYTTHNKKKYSSKVLYVLCRHEDRNEVNTQIESLSNVIPWTYYESKYFHAFDSELKSNKIKDQRDLHDYTISYLIPGFIDNDTTLMNYTKHQSTGTGEALSSNTAISTNKETVKATQDQLNESANNDNMEADANWDYNETDFDEDEELKTEEDEEIQNNEDDDDDDEELDDANSNKKNNDLEDINKTSRSKATNTNETETSNQIIIPDEYVGSFMEHYYKNEHGQPFYFQVGPVIENQREVLVFKKNRLYAEKMNQIVIGDLSLHMTPEACGICLNNNIVQQQIQIYRTWKPCHIQNYMATKNIYKLTDTDQQHHLIEQPKKRHRNEVPTMVSATMSTDDDTNKKISAAAAEVFSDDFIDLVKQTTNKHLTETQQTNDTQKIDKVEFDTAIEEWKTKFDSLEETIIKHNTTIESLITTLNINEIKTTTRFGTVYDTIETKCNALKGTVLKVKEDTQEMYDKAQEKYDTKHDELLRNNRALDEKMDRLLGHFNKKSEKKMKSKQAIEAFKEQLTHHTSEGMIITKDE